MEKEEKVINIFGSDIEKDKVDFELPTFLKEQMEKQQEKMNKDVKDLEELAVPIIEYLRERQNPHTTVIITGGSVELMQGIFGSSGDYIDKLLKKEEENVAEENIMEEKEDVK